MKGLGVVIATLACIVGASVALNIFEKGVIDSYIKDLKDIEKKYTKRINWATIICGVCILIGILLYIFG